MSTLKIYEKCITQPYYLLANDTLLPSDSPLSFRQSLLDRICNNS